MGRLLRSAAVCAASLALVASSASATETITYTYDAQGQVIAVDRSGSVNSGDAVDITYDKAGNRTNYLSADSTTAFLSIGNASVTEGGSLSFTVTRTGYTSSAVSVSYASASGTATSGTDFTAVSSTLNFTSGQTTKTITVSTTNDTSPESNETMTVSLSSPSSGTVIATGAGSGTGTINDNDALTQLTDGGLNVLTAHQSTYACGWDYTYLMNGIVMASCVLNATSNVVYFYANNNGSVGQAFDTGYSFGSGLMVDPAYYGTGDP
jgi:YD repeat-containing protein